MTIKRFNEVQIQTIRNIWSIDCPEVKNLKKRCKHNKLPDKDLENFNMNAWE